MIFACEDRTIVNSKSKTLSKLNWMLCYKHVLVINLEYCGMVLRCTSKRNWNCEDTLVKVSHSGFCCPEPVHFTYGIKYKHIKTVKIEITIGSEY